MKIKEPTPEECSSGSKVYEDGRWRGYATWYPQMGGYVGKCVIVFPVDEDSPCFEAYIWHDGSFPFGDDDEDAPSHVHHCMAEQFVRFGRFVEKKMEEK